MRQVDAAVWATTPIFIRYLTEEYGLPPLVLAFWRDLLVEQLTLIQLAGSALILSGVVLLRLRA